MHCAISHQKCTRCWQRNLLRSLRSSVTFICIVSCHLFIFGNLFTCFLFANDNKKCSWQWNLLKSWRSTVTFTWIVSCHLFLFCNDSLLLHLFGIIVDRCVTIPTYFRHIWVKLFLKEHSYFHAAMFIRVGKIGSLGPWSRVIVYCSKLSFCQNYSPIGGSCFYEMSMDPTTNSEITNQILFDENNNNSK